MGEPADRAGDAGVGPSRSTFSVVICTRNSAATLPDAIRSVEAQDYPLKEIVFVDGNSTDGTLDLIDSVRSAKVVVTGSAAGISAAMNAGRHAANGSVLCFLHSDDYLLHERVLSRVNEALARTGATWCYGRILLDRDGGLFTDPTRRASFSYPKLLRRNFIRHPSVFLTAGAMDDVGDYDTSLQLAMDYDYWLRLARRHAPLDLQELTTVFRQHAGSISTSNPFATLREDFEVRRRYAPRFTLPRDLARYHARRVLHLRQRSALSATLEQLD